MVLRRNHPLGERDNIPIYMDVLNPTAHKAFAEALVRRHNFRMTITSSPIARAAAWEHKRESGERGTVTTDQTGDAGGAGETRANSGANSGENSFTLTDFQQLIRRMYFSKDAARGIDGTFMWLVEEIGELAAALRDGTPQEKAAEFADVLAWLVTIANVAGVDLSEAVLDKYGSGCPGCGKLVCSCPDAGKP